MKLFDIGKKGWKIELFRKTEIQFTFVRKNELFSVQIFYINEA